MKNRKLSVIATGQIKWYIKLLENSDNKSKNHEIK